MKKRVNQHLLSLAFSALLLVLSIGGCANPDTTPDTTSDNTVDYSNLFFTDELPDGWQSTSLSDFEVVSGQKLPVPAYLPPGYEIKEVYADQRQGPTYILVLII